MNVKEQVVGKLQVNTYQNRGDLGTHAATLAAAQIIALQKDPQKIVRMIFASAPSQSEFLAGLQANPMIDWSRIEAFHMDEYVGLATEHPQSFGRFLQDNLFSEVPIGKVHFINGQAEDAQAECERYAALLKEQPIDLVCMGIGENTHIAFNDPHVADFNDPYLAKLVDLDEMSRQQQVNDGCFPQMNDVPTHAITLTVPALMAGNRLYCMVPGPTKAQAVKTTLQAEVNPQVPSSILRTHPQAILFLDQESAANIN